MEVGKAATHSPALNYAKRWDAIGSKDPFYSASDSWRDRYSTGLGTSTLSWSDASPGSVTSHTPSLSSVLPGDEVVDKELYHELMEMVPLIETLMEKKQGSKSFPRYASLVYTPNPRDALKASEQAFRTKKGNGHLYHGNQLDQNTPMISQLKEQMEQLERKLLEKDIQMQGIEASTRQAVLLQFRAREEEFKEQISRKEMEIEKILNRMSGTQHEVEGLRQLLEKAESDVEASNMNVLELQKESHNLQCQVAASLLWMESIASQLDNELADEELDKLIGNSDPATVNGRGGGIWTLEALVDDMSTELSRRKYLASLIAAKRNPTVEMLLLAAELRDQLKASVLQSGRKNT